MAKWRKKPVVINAYQITQEWFKPDFELPMEILKDRKVTVNITDKCIYIETLEGTMRGDIGNYLIQGVKGEVYACREDIFLETYQPL